jgi:hypothetical protein
MKSLNIGTRVIFDRLAAVDYGDEDDKVLMSAPIKPMVGWIVGIATKRLGRRQGGIPGEDYEPAYLQVSGTVYLWQVKTGLRNKILLVRDEDIQETPCQLAAPSLGPKPDYITYATHRRT